MGFFAFGCAASTGRPDCDGGRCGGPRPDLATEPPLQLADLSAVLGPDLTTGNGMKPFGEPCGDKTECASGICILAGIGGTCSRPCASAPCPEGYGCYGVLGAVDPGVIVEICVPERNQLCTPCTHDSECSTTSRDFCLPSATGGSFCGRDCTTVACPTGYTCKDHMVGDGGTGFKQCVPNSTACDCDASTLGAKKSCSIATPFGTCTGARTCQGATGWSACAPPNTTDVPDDQYADENCDGIDGDLTKGILVAINAAGASDTGACGLTLSTPCRTIQRGIDRAAEEPRQYVFVQAGNYNENVALYNGVHVIGGYNTMWVRATHGTVAHDVRITGGLDSTENQFMTLRATSLAANTIVDNVIVVGPNVPGTQYGKGSYAVHVYRSKLTLRHVRVIGGNGGPGAPGTNGTSASQTVSSAMNGKNAPPTPPGPGPAVEESDLCDEDGRRGRGGDPGTNSCSGSTDTRGGYGGAGGKMDTNCTRECFLGACGPWHCGNCNATDGLGGEWGFNNSGGWGWGGGGGAAGTDALQSYSKAGDPGGPGIAPHGSGGTRHASQTGTLSGRYWIGRSGNGGALGSHGGGGGGGGGSGGDDEGTDSWGAGGGGGGAGGCRASVAGTAGGGAGGSFGVFAYESPNLVINDCDIELGVGGTGGRGGNGGAGQPGGSGANGGAGDGADLKNGGAGGTGGRGGHSGAGAGGNGGVSYGVYWFGNLITPANTRFTGSSRAGAAGGGGTGTTASQNGDDGLAGVEGNIGSCASAGGC